MCLIEKLSTLCKKLAQSGWAELLEAHGLNIVHNDPERLKEALFAEMTGQIQRRLKGFEDFACEGRRGIEAGAPA